MRVIGYRQQRTLAGPAEVSGTGFVAGRRVTARFLPAAADTGLAFRRTDLPNTPLIPAAAHMVTATERRTTLGPPDAGVTLVEHALAALAGLRIDNCVVELDGPEPPGLDGSCVGFVAALASAGATLQTARRPICGVDEPCVFTAGGATVALHPSDREGLMLSYRLDYGPGAPIPPQAHTLELTPENFVREVASCRTFLTEAEAHAIRAAGVGKHLTAADVLVFGRRGPVGNRLRFADEPARHKVLDMVGDLALCGFDLVGHVVAYRSGHALNARLAATLAGAARATKPACRPPTRRAA
ncbi:UDP-3-O-acyl-N-acetylglucosamine deacetylase [Urbifossiella limnaea]|uniref:UDP-3-O-acyl-N-acetylglucosamine deacetylase n=1 Tax=Urbifossiella limnaea TaxID=2528023 RepID=A0A517XRX2_9BACT|nr:UDP-3-O-acyl-N-acetylglucosamine deacetylase [Urbifossiella limnaea]QDU20233.1 UDP-3-O-[3-hydroxymyristoyl] N-acetylglucosamine deacetylase [Urbifossiella limnaea]